jgi:hypothetical protein
MNKEKMMNKMAVPFLNSYLSARIGVPAMNMYDSP